MSDATINTLKNLAIAFSALGAFIAYANLVPDDAESKQIVGIVLIVLVGLAILYFTPLGNPIKALYRKIMGIK